MKNFCTGAIALALAVSCIWTAESRADQTRQSITPLLILGTQFDSNYFKTNQNEEDVFTFLVQPGIEATVETERSHLSLYYTLDAYFYDDDIAADLDFIGHTMRFDAGTSTRSKRLKFRVKDDYKRSRDPAYTENLTTSVNRAEYGINTFNPEVQHIFGNAVLGLGYKNVQVDYDKDLQGEDSTQNRGIGKIDYSINNRNTLGAHFEYWKMDYDDNSIDYDSWQATAAYTRRGKYLTLDGGIGWQVRDFDSQLNTIEDYLWYVALGGIKGGSSFSIRADSNFNVNGQGNQYYRTNKLTVWLDRTFDNTKLKAGLKGSIQNSNYEFTNRDDDIFALEGSLRHPLTSWLTASATAGYEDSNSSIDANDYDNTYGILMLHFIKPIGPGKPVISK